MNNSQAPTVFKTCNRCNLSLPEEDFYVGPDGEPINPCKACKTIYQRERRAARKAEVREAGGELSIRERLDASEEANRVLGAAMAKMRSEVAANRADLEDFRLLLNKLLPRG